MVRGRHPLLLATCGFALAGSLLLASDLVSVWRANEKLSDGDFLEHPSDPELVEASERVLSFPIGNHHDACFFLLAVGDVSSAPALLRAVRRFDETQDGRVCTEVLCFDALKRVTGHDEGSSPRAWSDWWRATGSKMPRSAFPDAPVRVPR
jgi:hypothetical protein